MEEKRKKFYLLVILEEWVVLHTACYFLIKFLKVQNYDFIVLIPEKGEFVNYLENEGIEYIVQPIRRRFIPKLMCILLKKIK